MGVCTLKHIKHDGSREVIAERNTYTHECVLSPAYQAHISSVERRMNGGNYRLVIIELIPRTLGSRIDV